jgi:amino acid transporter
MDISSSLLSFCIIDIDQVVGDDASQFPVMQIIFTSTGSYAATCVLGTLLIVLLFFSTVTTVASASRQIWAFSRDHVSGRAYSPQRGF